jgi:hypothetical protein
MIVTDKQYFMDKQLIHKLDLMIERFKQNKDNLLICEGGEGDGKTTMSVACAYYIAYMTKRPFSVANIFFDVEKMIEFAQNTEEQIIIWDEPALSGLTTQWWNETQTLLTQILMMARKKKHFFIFNVTKFFKFNSYSIRERSIGMIHVYSKKNLYAGSFRYIKKDKIDCLFDDYRSRKQSNYRKWSSFRSTFPNVMLPKYGIIDLIAYEKLKDEAIMSIGKTKKHEKATKDTLRIDKLVVGLKEKHGYSVNQIVELFKSCDIDITSRTIYRKLLTGGQNDTLTKTII